MSGRSAINAQSLRAFETLRKATISYVMFARRVCAEQLGLNVIRLYVHCLSCFSPVTMDEFPRFQILTDISCVLTFMKSHFAYLVLRTVH